MRTGPIPYTYLRKLLTITWADLYWGYEAKLVTWLDMFDFAADRIASTSFHGLEVDLYWLGPVETRAGLEIVRSLAKMQASAVGTQPGKRWLYIAMSWIFDDRECYDDIMLELTRVYQDFDKPRELLPMLLDFGAAAGAGTNECLAKEYRSRAMDHWEKYLFRAGESARITNPVT